MQVIIPAAVPDTGAFTSAAGKTFFNSLGVLQTTAVANTLRPNFVYENGEWVFKGAMVEAAATNLLLNSLASGASLTTQSVTVTAQVYTLSFHGTGTVTLSGVSVAVVPGTGPGRVTHTFTPTAGSLTLTVSGQVKFANLTTGAAASSFIPTAGTAVTRPAETNTAVMATNAVDAAISAYSGVTSYAAGVQAVYANNIYQSRVASNTGNQPDLFPDKWALVGPVNRWAALDTTVATQTTAANMLCMRVKLSEVANALGVLNVEGTKAWVVVTDATEGIVYNTSKNLASTAEIVDFWEWFFLPITRARDAVFLDMPSYIGATVDVLILNEGGTAKCGVFRTGLLRTLGRSDYGTSTGIVDYSRVTEDDFGSRVFTRRNYAKRMNVPINLDSGDVDQVSRLLADYRQVPLIWIASVNYEATIVFGPYKSFQIVLTLWSLSRCDLEIQGLI